MQNRFTKHFKNFNYAKGLMILLLSLSINRLNAQTLEILPADTSACSYNIQILLTIVNPDKNYTYTWSPASSLSASTGNSVIATPSVTTTYTVTGDSAGHTIAGTDIINVIASPPTPTIIANNGTLTSSSNYDNRWFRNDSVLLGDSDRQIVIPRIPACYVVEVSNEANGCSVPSDSICFYLKEYSNLPGDTGFCNGVVLFAPPDGVDYEWSPSAGLSATTGDTVVASPSSSTVYTVTDWDNDTILEESYLVLMIPSPNQPTFEQVGDTLISSSRYDNQWYRNDTLLLNDTSQYLIISDTGEYWVVVTNHANGCSTSSNPKDITATGIERLYSKEPQLTVYPNPVAGILTVYCNQPIDEIDVVNELGQILLRDVIPMLNETGGGFRNNIDVSDLPSGMYFISAVNNNGRCVIPVVKE